VEGRRRGERKEEDTCFISSFERTAAALNDIHRRRVVRCRCVAHRFIAAAVVRRAAYVYYSTQTS